MPSLPPPFLTGGAPVPLAAIMTACDRETIALAKLPPEAARVERDGGKDEKHEQFAAGQEVAEVDGDADGDLQPQYVKSAHVLGEAQISFTYIARRGARC